MWMRRIRSTRSFGCNCIGSGFGFSAVFLRSSGARRPAFSCIMRATVSQDMPTALRIIRTAATA